jgi:hypothetical protein
MRMGENGRRAVLDQYNWRAESAKLIAFYDHLSRPPRTVVETGARASLARNNAI